LSAVICSLVAGRSFCGAVSEQYLVILQKTVVGLTQGSLERFVLRARRAAGLHGTANVLVTSSTAVRVLNRQFREKNSATDVLSFPTSPSVLALNKRSRRAIAGDIAISADIAAENAIRFGHAAAEEVKILALHGILHLAGYDHERDNGRMARKEAALRRQLKLPMALIERVAAGEQAAAGGSSGRNRSDIEPERTLRKVLKQMRGRRSGAAPRSAG
jgi:probable rRNA maturation factor